MLSPRSATTTALCLSAMRAAQPGALKMATLAIVVAVLAGCASSTHRAPVEERKPTPRAAAPVPAQPGARAPAPSTAAPASVPQPVPPKLALPGWENAGKPGHYTVKAGDTLIRIALDHGQNWRDVARWSGLDNPNIIEVGQVLRVAPPAAASAGAEPAAAVSVAAVAVTQPAATPIVPAAGAAAQAGSPVASTSPVAPVPSATAATTAAVIASPPAAPAPAAMPSATSSAAPSATASLPVAPSTSPARELDEELSWSWPSAGPVAAGFDEVKSKGLAITGKAGDPVLAAADGRVVYAGSGLRGYGNLVIVKHNATYLTAYAHNQALLVKEDQAVRRGQKIAEMGSTDADRVQLHFEVRRQGKPVDPMRLLPQR